MAWADGRAAGPVGNRGIDPTIYFARPDDGTCRIVVEFGGVAGRAPSVPVTRTFAC